LQQGNITAVKKMQLWPGRRYLFSHELQNQPWRAPFALTRRMARPMLPGFSERIHLWFSSPGGKT
jgi:hypothetical protein